MIKYFESKQIYDKDYNLLQGVVEEKFKDGSFYKGQK